MEKLYSSEDLAWVTELLGRRPRGLYQVVKYHPHKKHPMVIKVIPWVLGAPFPTIYWLTCPLLKKELSHLEKDGVIKTIESAFLSEENNLKVLNADHEEYRDERVSFFNETVKDWDLLPEPQKEIIKETGIGGIADFDHIKCLHLQYAYHLASLEKGGRLIGKYVDENFPQVKSTYQ